MKHIYSFIALLVFITSCKKETSNVETPAYVANVKARLKDSLSVDDYSQLDFTKTVLSKVDSVQLYYLRVPFKGKALKNDFVIVKTNKEGIVEGGKIIHLEGKETEYGEGKIRRRSFNGNISISSLNRKDVLNSPINNGYITTFHPQLNARETSLEPVYPVNVLPEVVVIAYVDNSPDYYSTWFYLTSFFYSTGGSNGTSGYYSSTDGYGGDYYSGGGGGYYSPTGGGSYADQTIQIDYDTYVDKEPIDIEKFLKCFDNIPDAGAQCEITIYADIPVDSDPNKIFDFATGSPGHTFIGLKKLNAAGDQSVLQYFGFYPSTGWKTITNFPIGAKFVDDGRHEYNASLNKSLTPEQLKSVIAEVRNLQGAQYDLDDFNCTDWALNVFNNQGYTLTIPRYLVPGSIKADGVNTPQGIYNKLKEMRMYNAPNSDKVSIDFMKGWVQDSNGACN